MAGDEVVIHDDWEPLSDKAIVVRGGKMTPDNLHYNAFSVLRESQGRLWGVCAGAADPPTSAVRIAAEMPYRGDWFCQGVLGQLRRAGFDVVMVDDAPHCVIRLGSDEWIDQGEGWPGWGVLRNLFSPPERRPQGAQR